MWRRAMSENDDLTPEQWRVVNEAVDWDARKTLADVFQDAGGRVVDLSEGTYDGLIAVARWGAIRAVETADEDQEAR
jgi:hypothetical protein